MSTLVSRWTVACAALVLSTVADSAPVWVPPNSAFSPSLFSRGFATAQGGRGQYVPLDSASPGVDDTSMGVDSPNTIASGTSANGWEWSVTRDVRTRPTPRVRDEQEYILSRILSFTQGLPRDARDAVQSAIDVARSANDLSSILSDLTSAASQTFRDEVYWRGADDDLSQDPPEDYYDHIQNNDRRASSISFRELGPLSVKREDVTFYWPSVNYDSAQYVRPFINAVVFRPVDDSISYNGASQNQNFFKGYPAVAFSIGWNSWTDRYTKTLTHLASHGFVVIAPTIADRRIRPLFAFERLSDHLRACLGWVVRENSRRNSNLYGSVDPERLGMFGHSSGAGAAVRATVDAKLLYVPGSVTESNSDTNFEDVTTLNQIVGRGVRAVAGLGAFLESSGLGHDDLGNLRDVSMFQLAGRRDSHVTPRQIADIAAAAVHAVPRAVAVLRYGTHCFLDEEVEYEYPDSQCSAALEGTERYSLTNPRDMADFSTSSAAWSGSLNPAWSVSVSNPWGDVRDDGFMDNDSSQDSSDDSALVMSPTEQLSATREYLAAFFTAELGGGDGGGTSGDVYESFEHNAASEARRKLWGTVNDPGLKRARQTHSNLLNGGRGGYSGGAYSGGGSLTLTAASPVEVTGLESFGVPPEHDVQLTKDQRMSRVEVLAWTE